MDQNPPSQLSSHRLRVHGPLRSTASFARRGRGRRRVDTPEFLRRPFAILTAYNPRSMLLPRKVNDQRHQVMRDLLVLGVYRVEPCVGFEDDPEGTWREPSWIVHGMDRDEAMAFGLAFFARTRSSYAKGVGPT